MRIWRSFFALAALLIMGCVSPEQSFKDDLTGHIGWDIQRYQKIEGGNFTRSEETADGKVEYFYEYTTRGFFDPAGSKCRYVMVVDKASQVIVGWRFDGAPNYSDYCRISN